MKKYILGVIVIILAGGLIYMATSKKSAATVSSDTDVIYFHGKGCPHCEIVEEYAKKNNVDETIKMDKGEIFFNKENSAIFKEKATICGIPENQMGVPLLWVKGKCYTGDKDIIAYFEEQLKNNNQ